MRSRTVLLITLSIVALLSIGLFVSYERAHDPEWWKHVGIKHDRGGGGGGGGGIAGGNVLLLDDGNMFVVPANNGRGAGDGAKAAQPLNGRGAESRRLVDLHLKEGVDYFADYDVNVGPPRDENGTTPVFEYIDITSPNSTWAGVWVSHRPHVAIIPEFMTDAECDQIKTEASKHMFRSEVRPYINSGAAPVDDVRTSSQAWLSPRYGVAKTVVDRAMRLFHQFPSDAHEELQVLKYEKGQKYDAHNDFFDPALYGVQATNRAATIFFYLADVAAGGETNFPRAGGRPAPFEFKTCDKGLRVRPKKRSIALFYDMTSDGKLDHTSLHGGCPVVDGVKYGGTLWIRR